MSKFCYVFISLYVMRSKCNLTGGTTGVSSHVLVHNKTIIISAVQYIHCTMYRCFFCKARTRPIFSQYGPHASSIKFLLLWLYFEFPDSIAHLYRRNARPTMSKTDYFYYSISAEVLRKFLVKQQRFLLSAKMFHFE